jgi:signal transduction histidine kinase
MVIEQGIPAERRLREQLDEIRRVEDGLRSDRTARQSVVLRRVIVVTSASAVVLGGAFGLVAWRQLATVAAGYADTQRAREAEAAALRTARAELERHAGTLQEQVAQRTTELQRANAQLEGFAASISHDLRAPLRGLQGLSQALLEDAGDRLEGHSLEYAQQIVKEAASMDQLIRDLLEYSRLSRADLTFGPVSLEDALTAAMHTVRREISERQADVLIEGAMTVVRANRAVLVQVFANLLSNAVKFSTVTPRVLIKVEEQQRAVRVWFEDNGIGVSPQHHERIFHVFERLHGSEAYPGTGIGLAIVREGVERLGGRVGIESREGTGSRFWVEFPQSEAA